MTKERMDTEEFAARVAAPLKGDPPAVTGAEAKVLALIAERARRRRLIKLTLWVVVVLGAAALIAPKVLGP